MPPRRLKYRQGDRINKRKIPPLSPRLAVCPEMSFLKVVVCHTASSLRRKTPPKRRQATLWVGNVQEVVGNVQNNLGGDTQHQGSGTTAQLLSSIALADVAALQNGAISFPDDTTRGSKAGPTQSSQQSIASVLLHHASQFASV